VDGEPPVFAEKDVDSRFRMPRAVFTHVYNDIKGEPCQRVNVTGRPQAHPVQKFVRFLSNGEAADSPEEYVRLEKSTTNAALKNFIKFIVNKYDSTYLRALTDQDITRILTFNKDRALASCIGSLDCSHWEWHGCPKSAAGQHEGDRASGRLYCRRCSTTTSGLGKASPAPQKSATTSHPQAEPCRFSCRARRVAATSLFF